MHGEIPVVIRFLDFLTGEVHPLAAIPVLTTSIVTQIAHHDLDIQAEVLGDVVLVHVHERYRNNYDIQLCLWCLVEWKTGRLVRVSVQDLQQLFQ
jgi:hypothetical protein